MAVISTDQGSYFQQIYGAVLPDGTPFTGTGFTAERVKEGTMIVKFERPFSKPPVPVCTVFGNEWMTCELSIAVLDIARDYFICTTSSDHKPVDCGFTFIVSGDL